MKFILFFVALFSSYMVIKYIAVNCAYKAKTYPADENLNLIFAIFACICWTLIYGLY